MYTYIYIYVRINMVCAYKHEKYIISHFPGRIFILKDNFFCFYSMWKTKSRPFPVGRTEKFENLWNRS